MAHETIGLQKNGAFTHSSKVKIKIEIELNEKSSSIVQNVLWCNIFHKGYGFVLGLVSFPERDRDFIVTERRPKI